MKGLDIAILEGTRTPFAKAFGALAPIPAYDLGKLVTETVMKRASLRPDQIDQVVFGNVAIPAEAANIARVIAMKAGIPQDRIAHTVHRNCASGMEAITTAAQLIQLGEAKILVAGGTESMSRIPLLYNDEATAFFMRLGRAKGWWPRLKTWLQFRPRMIEPVPGLKLGLTDPISGLIMGKTAEVLAEDFGIGRQEQDRFAVDSHRKAVAAQQKDLFAAEIMPVADPATGKELKQDIGPRKDQTLESLAKLPAIFKRDGSVTVGNSCMITDGAAAVVVMSGEQVRAEGRRPLGYLRAFAYAGLDPKRMGLGPVYATSKLLKQTGKSLTDFELIEVNEAFAVQVLACEQAFASDRYAQEHLDQPKAIGTLDMSKVNVNGGAIALGHPVGATGTRIVMTLLHELRRRGLRHGLATLCVGGGQGAALWLESA